MQKRYYGSAGHGGAAIDQSSLVRINYCPIVMIENCWDLRGQGCMTIL